MRGRKRHPKQKPKKREPKLKGLKLPKGIGRRARVAARPEKPRQTTLADLICKMLAVEHERVARSKEGGLMHSKRKETVYKRIGRIAVRAEIAARELKSFLPHLELARVKAGKEHLISVLGLENVNALRKVSRGEHIRKDSWKGFRKKLTTLQKFGLVRVINKSVERGQTMVYLSKCCEVTLKGRAYLANYEGYEKRINDFIADFHRITGRSISFSYAEHLLKRVAQMIR